MEVKIKDGSINFMDFNDCDITNNCRLPRPILSAERKELYESPSHCSQALQEMHRFSYLFKWTFSKTK